MFLGLVIETVLHHMPEFQYDLGQQQSNDKSTVFILLVKEFLFFSILKKKHSR